MERFSHPLTVIPQELPGSKEHALKKANPGPLSKKAEPTSRYTGYDYTTFKAALR